MRNGIMVAHESLYTLQEFKQYLAANSVKHIRHAPCHPASNSLAERFANAFKTA